MPWIKAILIPVPHYSIMGGGGVVDIAYRLQMSVYNK